jgi:hypothetical protein
MPLTQDQLTGLNKQIFILDYLANGLFPCQSDIVKLIRSKKRAWEFNDKFEYRMLLAVTNSGGTLNSQVFKDNIGLVRPGQLAYGIYRATYGSVFDGMDVDMMLNLETAEKRASFERDYATRLHSLRVNVASLFKNFAIHGQWGVVHQLRSSIAAPNIPAAYNPVANVMTAPTVGTPFTIKTPVNVFMSNFRRGKLLIKTKSGASQAAPYPAPWGPADGSELYLVLDNQLGALSLLPVGTTTSAWQNGDFLEVAQNREVEGAPPNWFQNWTPAALTVASGPFAGKYDRFNGTGSYTAGIDAANNGGIVGAMEGLADLFPWYTNPSDPNTRLGLDMPFRDQPNRLLFAQEQAGSFVVQQPGEHIIDAIMRGALQTKASVPYADIGIWMNEYTRQQMAYEEAGNVRVLRDNFVSGPIIYQRGIKSHDYQVGNAVIKEVVEDQNLPTDVIIIGPKDDISYNCWDNAEMQIEQFIQDTWGKSPPPTIDDIALPDELISKIDFSQRIIVGPPSMTDGRLTDFGGSRIRHPKNVVNVAYQESGALFTEYPYTYTVVKLLEPITDLAVT